MKIVITIIGLVLLAGCTTSITFEDLNNAEALVISPGKKWEQSYRGEELTTYLSTFREEEPSLTLVSSSQKGKIKVNGRWYPIEYSEVKTADKKAIITINQNDNFIYIKQ